MKPNRTWIVVADGSEVRIFLHDHAKSCLQQLPAGEFHDFAPPTRELVTDNLPRVQESVGPTRHGIEPRSDPHRQHKERFTASVVHHLDKERDAFDHLVVVAPGPAMSVFRKTYTPSLKQRLQHELVRDYVHQTSDYIYEQIHEFL